MTTLQLHHGDCLEKMKIIPDKSIDLIICDLPYGCLTGGGGAEKKRRKFKNGVDTGTEIKQTDGVIAGCSWDIKINLELFWKQVKRIRKNEHTPCMHFCSTKFGVDNTGFRCPTSVVEINNKKVKGQHPTAKPIELYRWLIERYSKVGDMVLDPTFGSCNSGIVSKELGRNYIGIEMDEKFYKKAIDKNI